MHKTDCVVIGAGVIGLAVARSLALSGREVILLEAQERIGSETSSRNSEVIHAGLYYPQDSLKAIFCVRGREMLYDFCEQYQIPHRRCGKLVIAKGKRQLSRLAKIHHQARRNNVDDVVIIEADAVARMEPALNCDRALWSPSTGIIDSHAYMVALRGDIEDHGGVLVFKTRVSRGEISKESVVLEVKCDNEKLFLKADYVVNCAGLHGDKLARSIEGIDIGVLPKYSFAKGNYFLYSGTSPFRSLIYPIPDEHGLGIHVTLDMSGRIRFGPDVEWVDVINYDVDPWRSANFFEAIKRYWPEINPYLLVPAYSGIRPKIHGVGIPAADFCIQDQSVHGVPGLINLFGIESPGLTSSLALADHVRDLCIPGRR